MLNIFVAEYNATGSFLGLHPAENGKLQVRNVPFGCENVQ